MSEAVLRPSSLSLLARFRSENRFPHCEGEALFETIHDDINVTIRQDKKYRPAWLRFRKRKTGGNIVSGVSPAAKMILIIIIL
jgi:hypothetical protein